MHAVVTVLQPELYHRVEALWDDLERRFGLSGARITPIPHFSWQIAPEYDFARVEDCLQTVAQGLAPFEVETTGIGVFRGPAPVVFIDVRRTPALAALHVRLWEALRPHRRRESPYYSPEAWRPHITLAEKDLSPAHVERVVSHLSRLPLRWTVAVDNLALIEQPQGAVGRLRFSRRFGAAG